MGKELPLAREEEEGQSVLLASTSSGESITTSSRGNKRTQKPNPSKGGKGRKAKDTKTKGKGGSKTERANASAPKRQRRRRDNQDRKQDRGDEGKDGRLRRSAQELGITHPGSYCDELETVPHYWVERCCFGGGSLFQCKFCYRYLWLPLYHTDAGHLGDYIKRYGKTEGYCRYLNRHRPAKLLMAKLQELRILEMKIDDKREFARLADKILSDKDYDRKEVPNG